MIMRGRRKGRNRSPAEEQEASRSSIPDQVGTGAVKLVEPTPAPPREPAITEVPVEPEIEPLVESRASPPLHETYSDLHSAHAELDDVLPPAEKAPRKSKGHSGTADTREPRAATSERAGGHGVATIDAPAPDRGDLAPSPSKPASAMTVPEHPKVNPLVLEDSTDATEVGEPEVQFQSAAGNPLPRVLAVANQKGGVGKTTTSVNLGAALAELGFRVLVVDLDPQGNATTGLGIDARNFELSMYDVLMRDASLEDCVEPTSMKNLFVAPATIALAGAEIELVPAFSRELKLRRAIESVTDDFDYVLIDCPPSLGLITVNALAAAGEVLVPIQCEYYALEGLSQLMRNVHLVASNLNPALDISTIVLTMYDARTKLADQVAEEVRHHFGAKVCRVVIPRTVRLSEAPSFGQPITAFDPASRGAIAYRELAKEVSGGTT